MDWREKARRCVHDPEFFITNFIKIRDQEKDETDFTKTTVNHLKARTLKTRIIPFNLWNFQKEDLEYMRLGIWLIVLKARQLGLTWLADAYGLWLALFRPGSEILALSITKDKAQKNLRRVHLMYTHLPDWIKDQVPLIENNKSTLIWDHGGVDTSGFWCMPTVSYAATGETPTLLFIDEAAKIDEQGGVTLADILSEAMPALERAGQIILVSNGELEGDTFSKYFWKAFKKEAGSPFVGIFHPWSVHPERDAKWYEAERLKYPTQTEFESQFPASPHQAFKKQGSLYFDIDALDRYEPRKPWRAGKLAQDELGKWAFTSPGGWKVYRQPQERFEYLISVDPGSGHSGNDPNGIQVLNLTKKGQDAVYNQRADTEVVADDVEVMAKWLPNRPLIVIERNSYGLALIKALKGRGLKLLSTYIYDERERRKTKKIGWYTSRTTKPLALQALALALRNEEWELVDSETLAQFRVFIHLPGSTCKVGAIPGEHDDLIDALAIGVYVAREHSPQPAELVTTQSDRIVHAIQNPRQGGRRDDSHDKALPRTVQIKRGVLEATQKHQRGGRISVRQWCERRR